MRAPTSRSIEVARVNDYLNRGAICALHGKDKHVLADVLCVARTHMPQNKLCITSVVDMRAALGEGSNKTRKKGT